MTEDEEGEEEIYFTPEIDEFCKDYTISDLIASAYTWPGEHHKLWWIEQLAARLGIDLPETERGIPP